MVWYEFFVVVFSQVQQVVLEQQIDTIQVQPTNLESTLDVKPPIGKVSTVYVTGIVTIMHLISSTFVDSLKAI